MLTQQDIKVGKISFVFPALSRGKNIRVHWCLFVEDPRFFGSAVPCWVLRVESNLRFGLLD